MSETRVVVVDLPTMTWYEETRVGSTWKIHVEYKGHRVDIETSRELTQRERWAAVRIHIDRLWRADEVAKALER